MSLEDRKKKEGITREMLDRNPNLRREVRKKIDEQEQKELLALRHQVESKQRSQQLGKLKKQVDKKSLSARAELTYKQLNRMAQEKRKTEKAQGNTEQGRKAP